MEVTRLTKDELLHEVGVRGQKLVSGDTTVKDLRVLFANLKASEAEGDELEDALLPVDVEAEVSVVGAKLQEATDLLDAMLLDEEGGAQKSSNATRVRTITSHCNKRLVRSLTHAVGDERKSVKKLLVKLTGLVEDFRRRGGAPVYAASSVRSVSSFTVTEPSRKEDSEGDDSDSEPKRPKGPKVVKIPKDLHKWGIKFSGEEGISVLSFIMDVEEKAAWKQIELNSLLICASEFFTGAAKTWFRSVKSTIDSWAELKIALRREFLPLDYYDNLWDEIRARKQGPNESMGTFMANMLALFDRLEMSEGVNEAIILKTIMKNLAPFYVEKLALVKVLSLGQLKEFGKELEVSKLRVENYDGKNKPKKMEPEFALKSTRPKKSSIEEVSVDEVSVGTPKAADASKPPSVKPEGTANPKASSSKMKCWKCDTPGHRHSECVSEVKRTFCYRCGMKGVTVRNCSRCRRMGEDQ